MYAEQAAIYLDGDARARIGMCARQQALIFTADGRPDIAALADDVIVGSATALDALTGAVCAGPNWAALDDDGELLAAMQGAWPAVAAALHGTG